MDTPVPQRASKRHEVKENSTANYTGDSSRPLRIAAEGFGRGEGGRTILLVHGLQASAAFLEPREQGFLLENIQIVAS